MEKIKLKLFGCPPKDPYRHFSLRSSLDGREYQCAVGKFNLMILNVRGYKGLKILKNYPLEDSDILKKARELIRIHRLFFEEGIGPQVDNEVVEIEFDSETLEDYMPYLQSKRYTGEQRWYGYWIETLKPKIHFSIFHRARYHHFVQRLRIVCLRNEIYRRNSTQCAIDEFLRKGNYFYTDKGFQIVDVDKNNGIGPIVMNREKLISLIKEGAQFPVKSRPRQYQAIQIKDINLKGGRNACNDRLKEIGFDPTLFQNASFVDIGCNIGAFCFEAQKHGATLTLGLDSNDEAIEAAKCLRNYAKKKNMLFLTYNLNQGSLSNLIKDVAGQTKFDIVFALSIVQHVKKKKKIFQQLDQLAKRLLVLEGHANETEDLYRTYLLKYTHFSKVDFKGYSLDRNRRPVLFCWK